MTIKNEYNTTILSSYKIFKEINKLTDIKSLEPILFDEVSRARNNISVPDYVFKNIQEGIFSKSDNFRNMLNNSLSSLASPLYTRNNFIYVQNNKFHIWQDTINKVSPLIIISYFIYKKNLSEEYIEKFQYSSLPSIYNKKLNNILKKNEIIDTHIHLNGTTEADIIWQDILQTPQAFIKDVDEGLLKDEVKEQYLALDMELGTAGISKMIYDTIKIRNDFDAYASHSIRSEIKFLISIFKKINLDKKCSDTMKLWEYILVYNFIYQLLVQQNKQVGFDQFQKITFNNIRENVERASYKERYKQVKSIYGDNVIIEGRFAPKDTPEKMIKLLDNILHNNENIHLIAHFIKAKDKQSSDEINTYRDMPLRLDLDKRSRLLITLMNKTPKYKKHIKAVDGAANELHARAEVFAPSFRFLRQNNIENFTFHGGEDFIDIVSGIRYVYEIAKFLRFRNGDRIGHATALGINPKLWKERIGKGSLYIKQGEYLDNLVFIYHIAKVDKKKIKLISRLKNKIQRLCYKIYNESLDIYLLEQAWLMRKEDPKNVLKWDDGHCEEFYKYPEESINIFTKYHSNQKTIEAYNEKIKIKIDLISNKDILYLQNTIIEKLNKKNIIIETMISSNVRISFYKSYNEHHIKKWLGLTKEKNPPKPILSIATDNPGIFATNMRNELSHLYLLLLKTKMCEEDIFKIINNLLKNNVDYRF